MELLTDHISQQDGLPSPWQIVQWVAVSLGSAILRNGVSLIDLPGKFVDSLHSRSHYLPYRPWGPESQSHRSDKRCSSTSGLRNHCGQVGPHHYRILCGSTDQRIH
jgi:hypothetical protein